MKKTIVLFFCVFLTTWLSAAVPPKTTTVDTLLQAKTRTPAQTRQVLDWFLQAKQPNLIFSTGASLVRIPPERIQETRLLHIFLRESDMLKKVFAAVILTAMGTEHAEFSSLLQQATQSADPAVRAYAASAYTLLNAPDAQYSEQIVHLYKYDPAFAQRALNILCATEKQVLAYVKQAARSSDPQVRAAAVAWLGDLQTPAAAKYLLKMAKKETNTEVSASLATALAKNRIWTLNEVSKGLQTAYQKPASATYALAMGFMTGYAVDTLKQSFTDKSLSVRINAARAAAYMAGVLSSPQAYLYSTDPAFDSSLLKGLIPALTVMARQDQPAARPYAENALAQLAKLK